MIASTGIRKPSSSIKQQGNCKKCGSSIFLSKRLCVKCTAGVKEEAYLKKNHILRFMGPNGEYVKQLPNVSSYGHFTFSKPSQIKFDLRSPANEIINHLLGLVFDKVEYVSGIDRHWLMAMLIHLSESELTYYKNSAEKITSILDISVSEIIPYLHNWIMSFFQEDHHPLLPTYALATTKFIGNHLFGTYWRSEDNYLCYLEAWIDENIRTQALESFLLDKNFKKEFTQQMPALLVVIEMPDNAKLVVNFLEGEVKISKQFDFLMTRCYLSENIYHFDHCKLANPNREQFDIFSDFELQGQVQYHPQDIRSMHYLGASIPARWAIGIRKSTSESEIIYLPKWLIG